MLPNPEFWRGKRVLLTGHTGFKGAWMALWLHRMGALVSGVSLPPAGELNLSRLLGQDHLAADHHCDVRDAAKLKTCVQSAQPEVVLHLAAQALVRAGYEQPTETFSTNMMGTVHVLDAVRYADSVKVMVVSTTDKVYQNREWAYPYREADTLGGNDPYSASKAATELIIASYRASFLRARGVALASGRAGNVIGGGDWAIDRLIPDAVRAWGHNQPLFIRRPDAVRPWQHVLEPLAGYLVLAEQLWHDVNLASAYNFGPAPGDARTVRVVTALAQSAFGQGEVVFDEGGTGPHEAGLLALDVTKARMKLGVKPQWTLDQAIVRTMRWYAQFAQGHPARDLCLDDIGAYQAGGVAA